MVGEQMEFIRQKVRQAQAQPSGSLQTPVQADADGRKRNDSTLTQHHDSRQRMAEPTACQLQLRPANSILCLDPALSLTLTLSRGCNIQLHTSTAPESS